MSSFRSRYGVDKNKAEEGVWLDKGDDFHVRIRRLNSKAVKDCNTRLMKPYKHMTRGGREMPASLQEKISRQLLAEAVLLEWKGEGGPRDDNEKLIPYSVDAAVDQFTKFPDFMEEVFEDANTMANFQEEALEDDEGNS